jgi:hypothetical protein
MLQVIRFVVSSILAAVGYVLLLPFVIGFLPLWFISWMSRKLEIILAKKSVRWDEIIEYDREIGWKPKPHVNGYYLDKAENPCFVQTDQDGWPGKNTLDESDIVVFGDSFAYGFGIDLYDSYAYLNENFKTKPIGAPGYNMVQSLLLMRQFSGRLRNKIVVWFVCLENDLFDNIRPYNSDFYTTPFVYKKNGLGAWSIETEHITPERWYLASTHRQYDRAFAKFCTPSSFSEYTYGSVEYLLGEAVGVCSKVNATLVVMTIPRKEQLMSNGIKKLQSYLSDQRNGFDPDFPDKQFEAICSKLGVKFIAAKKVLNADDYLEQDPHWNKKGNRKIARILNDIYNEADKSSHTAHQSHEYL